MHANNIVHRDLKPGNIMAINPNSFVDKIGEPLNTKTGKGSKKGTKQASRVEDVVHNVLFPFLYLL